MPILAYRCFKEVTERHWSGGVYLVERAARLYVSDRVIFAPIELSKPSVFYARGSGYKMWLNIICSYRTRICTKRYCVTTHRRS